MKHATNSRQKRRIIVGVDEVGRGPLAGPVTVAVCILPLENITHIARAVFPNGIIKDSKKLAPKEREQIYKVMSEYKKDGLVDWQLGNCSNTDIDKRGIGVCIRSLVEKNLSKIKIPHQEMTVYLDGGLKAPTQYFQKTIIKGDEKVLAIALASIVAKVTRDRYMVRMEAQFPGYGFDSNKGYGTREHIQGVKKLGLCRLHRQSFCRGVTNQSEI